MQIQFTAKLFQFWSSCPGTLRVCVAAILYCHTLCALEVAEQSDSPFVGRSYSAWGSGWDPFWTTIVSACQVSSDLRPLH